ncbi:MAG: aminotransferase class I/II-fold pyridoxal phosphate-dependent enzyme [Clostridia bacterium]|nr:aminotransferase class I/II-fold pyridoxal phosphate-dependent enzyme [Clostridia bacterium]
MISFDNDYNRGAHPALLDALVRTNMEPCTGYGFDPYCESAKEKIRAACGCPDAQITFAVGGTQTNSLVIRAMLHEYEGVVAADSGHISQHEAGAVEGTGHKVLQVPGEDGKIRADVLKAFLDRFFGDDNHDHMVFPGMVYISYPTETGSLYTKAELTALHEICKSYHLPLFLDGARLGYGLESPACDMTMADIAEHTDVFYIGGTKVGALIGEAIVFTKNNMPAHFMTTVKRHGALLAKGRVLGVQFDTLFTDDLYFKISRHAMEMAGKLKDILVKTGCRIFMESPTNQQFIIIENEKMKKLSETIAFSFWEAYDENHTVIRFVTSWATAEEELTALEAALTALNH